MYLKPSEEGLKLLREGMKEWAEWAGMADIELELNMDPIEEAIKAEIKRATKLLEESFADYAADACAQAHVWIRYQQGELAVELCNHEDAIGIMSLRELLRDEWEGLGNRNQWCGWTAKMLRDLADTVDGWKTDTPDEEPVEE